MPAIVQLSVVIGKFAIVIRRFFLILFFLPAGLYAQHNFSLEVIPLDKDTSFLNRDYSYRRVFADTVARNSEMKNVLAKLFKNGFLEASFQNFARDTTHVSATLLIGKQWEWASLSNGNVDEVILNRMGFKERLYDGK